jgi:hypothetical protein
MKHLLSHNFLVLFLIFFTALGVRLYGLNWDQGQHLHPDERYLTMVTSDIRLPNSVRQYFDNHLSPLNPYNYPQYTSFVYGTFPLFLTKYLAVVFNYDDYGYINLLGRALSAVFDSFNIFLIYLLSKKLLATNSKLIFIPSLLYSLAVLPIQLSHFYAVDTFLNTFLLATFTLLAYDLFPLAAIVFGLAFTCKISALFFVPVILIFLVYRRKKVAILLYICLFFFTVRVFQPYIFDGLLKLDHHFLADLKTFQFYASKDSNYPPSVQWLSKTPILFPLQNIMVFGLGLPLSILFLLSTLRSLHRPAFNLKFIAWFWVLFLFIYQGSQFTHNMRYFLPIYPFIILLAIISYPTISLRFIKLVIFLQMVICLTFLNIYRVPHSRNQASSWIYQHISIGSTITNEYWDDPLPMSLPNISSNPGNYHGIMISPYDPDTPEKMQKLNQQLSGANYLIMSSNRLWGSIPLVPDRYPQTSKFYQDLFSEKTNFKKLVEINSYPGLQLPVNKCYYFGPTNMPNDNSWYTTNSCNYPGIYFRDDVAEEAFTVYDHPKVLIFENTSHIH